jgi:glycosyltransferase involved in cell wall biosynthesis
VRVTFCWPEISGYMAACWRSLAGRAGVDVRIIGFRSGVAGMIAAFADETVAGLDCRLLSPAERDDATLIESLVAEQSPDVVVLPGWLHAPYAALASSPRLVGARFVMIMDTPWRGTMRQRLARLRVGRYVARMDRVVVPGERAWQFARRLGAPESAIRRGLYGIDYALFHPLHARRASRPGGWPRRFLFTGRYGPDKGIDVLLEAYRQYRAHVHDPWPLTCCGTGPLRETLAREPGVEDRGFVQPRDLPDVSAESGAFVLASRFDPWPLVIAEACAAGLPVICTEACGSAVELVRSYYNGLTVATDDADALADAMGWSHAHHARLPEMGQRGQALAAAYAAEVWAERWFEMFAEIVGPRHGPAAHAPSLVPRG